MTSHRFVLAGPRVRRGATVIAAVALIGSASGAVAGAAPSLWERASHVTDTVTDNQNGTWTYGFTVFNDSAQTPDGTDALEPYLVDWELPYFNDAGFGLSDVVSPTGWLAAIESVGVANPNTGWDGVASWQDPGDPFYFGADSPFTLATQVLHWYSECWAEGGLTESATTTDSIGTLAAVGCEGFLDGAIAPGGSLAGFGFIASFDKTAAPYQASWEGLPVRTGDPAFPFGGIPGSPLAMPVPPSLPLLLVGIGALVLRRGHRRRAAA